MKRVAENERIHSKNDIGVIRAIDGKVKENVEYLINTNRVGDLEGKAERFETYEPGGFFMTQNGWPQP